MRTMSVDYEDEEEPLSIEEFKEIEASTESIISGVKVAQEHILQNEMEEALVVLNTVSSECNICQGEVDDAKHKVELVHDLCNIEKSCSDKRCQKMSNFILDNLNEFVENLVLATEELRDEAYGKTEEVN